VWKNHTFLTENGICTHNCDGASDAFFKALRGTIEHFSATTRFIATCNYLNKIPEPIQSRFNCIGFDCVDKEEEKQLMVQQIKRCIQIFTEHGIVIEKEAVIEFVKRNFPDMRTILNKIQMFVVQGIKEIKLEDIKTLNYSFKDVFEIACGKPNPEENYKFLMINYSTKVDDVLQSLGGEFIEYIQEHKPNLVSKIPQILIKVAHYQAQRNMVIDNSISMLACTLEVQMILNS
jgi:replication factor C small subunit